MAKTDLGYQAELDLDESDTINFCFKNQNNEWDNNFGNNYVFDIEKKAINQINSENGGSLVFWGKTCGKTDETETSSNIYWGDTDEVIKCVEKQPTEIVEECINPTPNSIDTVLQSKTDLAVEPAVNKAEVSENSIALTPTGFDYWTQKIKETVCKFFEYIPKIISGNYKRDLSNNKNK